MNEQPITMGYQMAYAAWLQAVKPEDATPDGLTWFICFKDYRVRRNLAESSGRMREYRRVQAT